MRTCFSKPIMRPRSKNLETKIIFLLLVTGLGVVRSKPDCDEDENHDPKIRCASRSYPWCITNETLIEYEADLPQGKNTFSNYLYHNPASIRSKCPTCRVGKFVDHVFFYRIKTNLDPTDYSIMQFLRQWMHIHVETSVKVNGLVVQANVAPYGMAYGTFDLEFGCRDCVDIDKDIVLDDAIDGKALELRGKAAAIPCRRRTYLHVRHPYVYVYAHEEGRSSFHMNYNYFDITCRLTKMIQFMFLLIPAAGDFDYGKTSIIDHEFVDSVDGMPYPYHVDFRSDFTCHEVPFGFENVGNGDLADIFYRGDYDDCIHANASEFDVNFKDTANFISNKVCKDPPRSKCDYEDPANRVDPYKRNPKDSNQDACVGCTEENNEFSREAFKRLIGRTYKVRRVHGVTMIVGVIGFGILSLHISRYLKETGGGCLLVGWWLWAHVGLAHVGKLAVYIGLVLGLCQPPRESSNEPFDIDTKRNKLIAVHKIIGAIAVLLLHVDCIIGPWRPASPTPRMVLVGLHAVVGYLSIMVAFAAVILSTACFDVLLYTSLLLIVSLIFWIVGMVLQYLMDKSEKLVPARKLWPVIEAVKVPPEIPMKKPRLVLLGVLFLISLMLVLLMSLKGNHKGLIFSDPCVNCIWKYDDVTVRNFNRTQSATEPMYGKYKCTLREGLWDHIISRPRS